MFGYEEKLQDEIDDLKKENKEIVEGLVEIRESLWELYPERQGEMIHSPQGIVFAVKEILKELIKENKCLVKQKK